MADGTPELVIVEWLDSHLFAGWRAPGDIPAGATVCRSVGWITGRDDVSMTIAPHRADNDDCNGVMVIPTCAVRSVTPLVAATCPSSCPAPE